VLRDEESDWEVMKWTLRIALWNESSVNAIYVFSLVTLSMLTASRPSQFRAPERQDASRELMAPLRAEIGMEFMA
jgi:hypothetical protein